MAHASSISQLTEPHIEAVRNYLADLSPIELKAIFMRFWGPCSVAQIAAELNLSWSAADRVVEQSVVRLRQRCIQDGLCAPSPVPGEDENDRRKVLRN